MTASACRYGLVLAAAESLRDVNVAALQGTFPNAGPGEHRLPCGRSMRELTDDRDELVRLVERVMHLAAGSTQEEDDAVVMELQRRVPRAAGNRSHFYPERTVASSSGKAEGMSREECLS